MNRRIFLRGLGGAVVAAPFLSSVADRYAKAQSLPAVSPPKRLIAMFTHYGCVTTRFFPVKSHGVLTAADLESTTLAPLSPHVRKLLIPRGIRAMNEWTSKLLRGQGNDSHYQVTGSYFTCVPISPNSNEPFSFNTNTRFPSQPTAASLDHVIAEQLSPEGVPLVARVANQLNDVRICVSFSAGGKAFGGLGTPSQLYSNLTGLFKEDVPVSPDSYQAAKGRSIIDLIRRDLDALSRVDMSRSDKLKLDAWKELLHQTGVAVTAAQCSQGSGDTIGATAANIKAASVSSTPITNPIGNDLDVADLYSAMVVLSAACNTNPVMLLKYPSNYTFNALGITREAHSLSHRLQDASMAGTCVAGSLEMLLKIDSYYAQKFAKLVSMLDSIHEGDQTLLDHSAAVWFQEMSDGAAHNLNNLPIIQAGGLSGYFKTGWTVNVEDGSANLSRGNSESACNDGDASAMINGITQSTGTPPELANKPINKYYCNLMNALGVKAGADGFPLKGGSAEVVRFGMYDKTEDFVGGGTNPPTNHDPGAFEALKANA